MAQAIARLLNHYWQVVGNEDIFSKLFIEASTGATMGGTFVLIGTLIAPSHNKEVSIAMMTIVAAFFGMGLLAAYIQGGSQFGAYVYSIAMVVSAGVSTLKLIEKFKTS